MPLTYTFDDTNITEGDWRDQDFGTLDQGLNGAIGVVSGIAPTGGDTSAACRVSLTDPTVTSGKQVTSIAVDGFYTSVDWAGTLTAKLLNAANETLATDTFPIVVTDETPDAIDFDFTGLALDQTASDGLRIEFDVPTGVNGNPTLTQFTVQGTESDIPSASKPMRMGLSLGL